MKPTIAVTAHLFYEDVAGEVVSYLKNIQSPFDIYISTHSEAVFQLENFFLKSFPGRGVFVRPVPNIGRDMGPFLHAFQDVYKNYELVCWIHSKKSKHCKTLGSWRGYLLQNLLGSELVVNEILSYFANDAQLGIVFPEHFLLIRPKIGWGDNFKSAKKLLSRYNIKITHDLKPEYPSGSMFWFRPIALRSLFATPPELAEFEEKSELRTDGTLAHAIERVLCIIGENQGYKYKKVLFFAWKEPFLEKIKGVFLTRFFYCIYAHLPLFLKKILKNIRRRFKRID